jgi:hypothetical protein
MTFSTTEEEMWDDIDSMLDYATSEEEINRKYDSREQRVIIEINREKLPNFVKSLYKPGHIDLQPSYQRRKRWTPKQQSQLIESFIVNVPVPPVVLYEKDYDSYEVMDGQQRINALKAFYENELELTGLELWVELNGYKYETLPKKIRAGIDRRSISTAVLITESTTNLEEAFFLKQFAFSRLNTGGVNLSRQEVRNCLYSGVFNDLLKELSAHHIFTKAWKITPNSSIFKKMGDLENVLRFFAFRHIENMRGSQEKFFDIYMFKSKDFSSEDINFLSNIFLETLELAYEIYGDKLFHAYNVEKQKWENRPYKAYYDAKMVSLSRFLPQAPKLIENKSEIVEKTMELFESDHLGLLTGGGKTKEDIQKRISMYGEMINSLLD